MTSDWDNVSLQIFNTPLFPFVSWQKGVCWGLAILSWRICDMGWLWHWQVGIRFGWWQRKKNIRIYTATNSEHSAGNMGTSCERAVSSAVNYLRVLPSVRLTLCWCSPNHFSSVWHRAQSSIIIIILNHPQRQQHNMSLNLTFRVNSVRLKMWGSGVSCKSDQSSCSQSATLANINRWVKDKCARRGLFIWGRKIIKCQQKPINRWTFH